MDKGLMIVEWECTKETDDFGKRSVLCVLASVTRDMDLILCAEPLKIECV